MRGMREQTVAANGIEIFVRDAGAGRPAVLLHGFPELGWSWRHQVDPPAGAGCHVIVPDLRGYGGTTAPPDPEDYDHLTLAEDVVELMAALGYDRFTAIGHDWGAAL